MVAGDDHIVEKTRLSSDDDNTHTLTQKKYIDVFEMVEKNVLRSTHRKQKQYKNKKKTV